MIHYFKKAMLIVLAFGFYLSTDAQTSVKEGVPKGWHLKDKVKDGLYGISLDKAYDFVKGKKSQTVIVAVIDSGIDTLHEDLKPVLWTNTKEIRGNGIDDDKNGYVDDVHGWNFIGGRDGRNVKENSLEVTRVYHKHKAKFEKLTDSSALSGADRALYRMWKKAEKQIVGDKDAGMQVLFLRRTFESALKNDSILRRAIGKDSYTGAELKAFEPATDSAKKAKRGLLYFFEANNSMEMSNKTFIDEFGQYLSGEEKKAEAPNKAPVDHRGEIVKDNEADINDRIYGNNDIMANTPFHGTHVAGIIGAVRNNNKGIDGIADNVRIMAIRAVPDGDEHDKDVALAIRYAVDNGARIINMSFGKSFSPEKVWVDDAVKYAESKGVLLVHAAGNDGSNVDTVENFPNATYISDSKKASTWLTVGASGDLRNGGIVASFSNYGKNEVDVFAPGHQIYSTIPGGNTYGDASGTSMASPVTAGVAAFLLSYYPTLTGAQLKYIIENSAVKPVDKVTVPHSDETASLADISKTGGLLNAYEAVKLAAQIASGKPAPLVKKGVLIAKPKPAPTKKPAPVKTF
jgi:subtilisin family serine protease